MRYFSVCSGIEAASAAWAPLGWEAVAFAEIDKFPSRVLSHHYSATPNLGDFTDIDVESLGPVGLLVGETPCQSFSIAGKGLSLADARGNLTLAYAVLAHELVRLCGLRWAVWENVPGIFSKPDNPFGCFLGALVGHDRAIPKPRGRAWPDSGMVDGPRGRAAWRVFDAQYFGLAQRRQRVFVVVGFGGGTDPAAVLFERQGLQGNSAPRREARQDVAPTISARTKGGGGLGTDAECDGALVAYGGNNTAGPIDIATAVNAHGGPCGRQDFESETFLVANTLSASRSASCAHAADLETYVTHALRADGFDASEDGTGRGTPLVPVAYRTSGNCGAWETGNKTDALTTSTDPFSHVVAFAQNTRDEVRLQNGDGSIVGALAAEPGMKQQTYIADQWAVRRLMPIECERLQGFPDGYTAIPGASDGGRYKALGNSMAVPCMRWIGRRIQEMERAR